MSRSGYSDDLDALSLGRWRGQIRSIIRGKRGQAFLRELAEALDALPEKRLISRHLRTPKGEVCTLGSLGVKRGIKLEDLDPYEPEELSRAFDIKGQLIQEIEFYNDECGPWEETPEHRWQRMRAWVESCIRKDKPSAQTDSGR